ncbi:MAG: sigma-70 family RNA polymerase sigma factor [Planctomycetes bacterium]|nr:sigma-70 family RNA polymerase sigma factor [Planctomycetota bacterium]
MLHRIRCVGRVEGIAHARVAEMVLARIRGAMQGSTDDDLREILDLAGSGDRGAIQDLLGRYAGDLEGYVRCHASDELAMKESSSDLVQSVCREVLEDAARGTFKYRGEAQFRSWLYQATLHKIQMKARYWRAKRREVGREEPVLDASGSTDERFLDLRTPSLSAELQEERQRLLATLEQLGPEQRQLIEWAHFEGLSHRQIAERLGITEAHSRVLLSRALARLARIASGPGKAN